MLKKTQVVMLPTNEKARIIKINCTQQLIYLPTEDWKLPKTPFEYQHLYILSDDEIIESNWFITATNNIHKCTSVKQEEITFDYESRSMITATVHCKKIIATTDESLKINMYDINGVREVDFDINLPQPSQAFIEVFVREYNKGSIITEVMVEYEERMTDFIIGKTVQILKVNPKDNTITIKRVKNSWNRDEVITNLLNYKNDLLVELMRCKELDIPLQKSFTDKWIEKNL